MLEKIGSSKQLGGGVGSQTWVIFSKSTSKSKKKNTLLGVSNLVLNLRETDGIYFKDRLQR